MISDFVVGHDDTDYIIYRFIINVRNTFEFIANGSASVLRMNNSLSSEIKTTLFM